MKIPEGGVPRIEKIEKIPKKLPKRTPEEIAEEIKRAKKATTGGDTVVLSEEAQAVLDKEALDALTDLE